MPFNEYYKKIKEKLFCIIIKFGKLSKSINKYKYYKNSGNYSKALEILEKNNKMMYKSKIEIEKNILRNKIELLNYFDFNKILNPKKYVYNMNCKNILHVLNTSVPYLNNGYSIRSKHIVEAQKKLGLNPTVVTRPGFPNDFKIDIDYKNNLHKEKHCDIMYYRNFKNFFMRLNTFSEYTEKYKAVIIEVAKKEKVSIIQSASNYVNGYSGLIAARELGIPFIYEVRGFWELTSVSKNKEFENSEEFQFAQKMETFICKNAEKVVVISHGLKKELIYRGIDEKKISIIPNGIQEVEKQELNSKIIKTKITIGYIGSLVDYEGIDTILNVIYDLKKDGFNKIEFIIAGDGSVKNKLMEIVKNLNLHKEVNFLGKIDYSEVGKLYSTFDLCIYPRIKSKVTEMVTPLKPLEAMMYGKLVIVSDLDAMKEIVIDGYNGIIFRNEKELKNILKDIIEKRTEFDKIKNQGKKWVIENRNWEKLSNTYLDLYREVTNWKKH